MRGGGGGAAEEEEVRDVEVEEGGEGGDLVAPLPEGGGTEAVDEEKRGLGFDGFGFGAPEVEGGGGVDGEGLGGESGGGEAPPEIGVEEGHQAEA